MAPSGWDRMAEWRDERSGETGDLWHRALIDPTLLEVIGPVRGLRVLEVGCGNGYLTRRFARDGARPAVGVDLSAPTIARAIARERQAGTGARFERASAHRLPQFADRSFDLVVANMALMDIADGRGTIREMGRLLDPDGRFVFSISHPCFDTDDRSMWVVERGIAADGTYADAVWRKVRGYREETRRAIPWSVAPGRTVFTHSFHRTLSTYSRLLRDGGFAIRRLEEPRPLAEMIDGSPQGRFIAEVPLHLVVEAIPVGVRTTASGPWGRSPRAAGRRSGSGGRSRRTGSARRGSTPGS